MSQEAAEEMMYNDVTNTCETIQHLEKEWDAAAFQSKIAQYLRKAGKSSGGSGNWQKTVDDFSNKFYETIASACYDRPWLDQADFTLPVASGIRAYCSPPNLLSQVDPDEYIAYVSQCCTIAHDQARYYASAWETMKTIVANKVALKKVREAVDTARESVVKQMPGLVEQFIESWVSGAIKLLGDASFQNNPKASLSQDDATRLFDALVQEGAGIPLWLEHLNGGKPQPGCSEIVNAVAAAYSTYPHFEPRPPKGKGKGKDGGDPWGGFGGGYGKGGGYDPYMMSMMQAWQAQGYGYSPY